MDLSIIIPSYNTKKLLRECLESIFESLKNSSILFETIVIDNNSSDGSVEMVKKVFPQARLIKNKTNMGYAKANNKAAKISQSKYLLFLNSDILVINGAVEKLYKFVSSNVEVNIAGGKLLNKDLSPQPSCGPFYSLPVAFAVLFLRGDRWGFTRYSPSTVKKVDWVSGACLCIKKAIFLKIGLFDEKIFMYMDEVEFLYRAKMLGYNVYFYPGARFIHYGSASARDKKYPVLNIFRGLIYLYKKHKMGAVLFILQLMLLLKAATGYFIGIITRDKFLKGTYGKAIREVIY